MSEQLQFAFPSLDFPGRTTLTAAEIAERLGFDEKHIRDLINEGELPGIDGKGKDATRGSFRVPIENYRDFITARMTGARRIDLLKNLPPATVRTLVRELNEWLRTKDKDHAKA
ncbi:MAG: helix-turn-helix domain-containing protein [Opitutaceae bacterium]|nr:helix-turn-helix domain-containing protein [Opitutaceae bacterium]